MSFKQAQKKKAPKRAPFSLCAHGGTRTRTSIGNHPLKMACLPIPPRVLNWVQN